MRFATILTRAFVAYTWRADAEKKTNMSLSRSFAASFVSFFRERRPDRRSGLGLLLATLMLPALLGVMGCFELPAPVGDPEKSRIDTNMSGVWLDNSDDSDGLMLIFEPYDKRTWLMRWIELTVKDAGTDVSLEPIPEGGETDEAIVLEDVEADAIDETGAKSYLELMRAQKLEVEVVALFKVWRKRISGHSIITMEFRGDLNSETGMEPRVWWAARVTLVDEDQLRLEFIANDFDEIEDAMTRSQLERVIRRNLDNPDLFVGELPGVLQRVPQDDYDTVGAMLDAAGIAASYD